MTKNKTIKVQTKALFDIIDLTDDINSFVKKSNIKNGLVNVQSLHTTASIIVQEKEPLLLEDIKKVLDKIAPKKDKYNHDDLDRRTVNLCDDECINGHSHCKAINLRTSVTLNLIDNKVQFGPWQRVLFFELDRARPRQVQIQILGE